MRDGYGYRNKRTTGVKGRPLVWGLFKCFGGTQDRLKTLVTAERVKANNSSKDGMKRRADPRVTERVVSVDEPLAVALNAVMERERVANYKLAEAMGVNQTTVGRMRWDDSFWSGMEKFREALWLMGYDIRFDLVKHGEPDSLLVLTEGDYLYRNVKKFYGAKRAEGFEKAGMWDNLGEEKFSE